MIGVIDQNEHDISIVRKYMPFDAYDIRDIWPFQERKLVDGKCCYSYIKFILSSGVPSGVDL